MNLDESQVIDVLRIIKKVLDAEKVEFVLIGGLVPSILINHGLTSLPENQIRETKDIDAALSVDSWTQYEHIKELLINEGFMQNPREAEHRLFYDDVEIDFVPMGNDLMKNGSIEWPKSGNVMNVAGYDEIYEHSYSVELEPNLRIRVATLWALVVLKVLAYDDRHFMRDAYDLFLILDNYEVEGQRRFDAPAGTDYDVAGAYLCGHDISQHVHKETLDKLLHTLDAVMNNSEYSTLISDAMQEARKTDTDEERVRYFALVEAFRRGITGS